MLESEWLCSCPLNRHLENVKSKQIAIEMMTRTHLYTEWLVGTPSATNTNKHTHTHTERYRSKTKTYFIMDEVSPLKSSRGFGTLSSATRRMPKLPKPCIFVPSQKLCQQGRQRGSCRSGNALRINSDWLTPWQPTLSNMQPPLFQGPFAFSENQKKRLPDPSTPRLARQATSRNGYVSQ